MIHPTAQIAANVPLGEGTSVGPYAIIESGVVIGARCTIGPHAILRNGTVLGDEVAVHSFAVIGGPPQDLKFDESIQSGVSIGRGTVVREGVTLNRATQPGGATTIGEDCYLMAISHLGHDCHIGDHVVLANNVMLAGHVTIGAHSFVGGGAGIHQHCRIGESVMIGGNASITLDVASFLMVAERSEIIGLNLIGLKRRGFSRDAIAELKRCYRRLFGTYGNIRHKAHEALASGFCQTDAAREFLHFFEQGARGFARPRREQLGVVEDEG